MKYLLIAAAALATAGSAMAQNSVRLYGRIDTSVAHERINGASTTSVESGLLSTSRWGLIGTEDLGGGLKANFNLEGSLQTDTGAGGATGGGIAFDRQSWVGLSGAFGAVRIGRSDTAFDAVRDLAVANNLWDSEFSPPKIAYRAGVSDYSSRASNQLRYNSPTFGGFSLGASYALDEQSGPIERDVTAVALHYKNGPFIAGIGHQRQDHEATPASDREYTAVSAAWKFSAFTVSGGYQRAENGASLRDDEYTVGAEVPFGAFSLSAAYAWSETEGAGGATAAEGRAFAIGATYKLSKRTRVYTALLDGDIEDGTGATVTDRRIFALGIRHDF